MRPPIATFQPGQLFRYAHLKRDGIWITLENTVTLEHCAGAVVINTRHPTDITDTLCDMLAVEEFRARSVLGDTLYCELFAPGEPASAVKHHMAEGNWCSLHIEAFATPRLPKDAPLTKVFNYATRLGVQFAPFVTIQGNEGLHEEGFDVDQWWRSQKSAEGVVYKDGNLLNWAKRKDLLTTDLVVSGFKWSKEGKYLGLIGAIELSLYDGTFVGRCSGMSDELREAISMNEEQYLGKVLEVEYQYIGAKGGLRHIRFKGFRDDKRPEECTEI